MTFKEWISSLPRCVCGRFGERHDDGKRYLHPHHVRTKGAGGGDDANLLGVCWICHSEFHQLGIKRWEDKRGIDSKKTAVVLFNLFREGVDPEAVRVGDSIVHRSGFSGTSNHEGRITE